MTNSETLRASAGVIVAAVGAATSYADQVEQWSRIGASWIAIISGCIVIWTVLSKHCKKRKIKNHENKTH
jgi:hypothetical protein